MGNMQHDWVKAMELWVKNLKGNLDKKASENDLRICCDEIIKVTYRFKHHLGRYTG